MNPRPAATRRRRWRQVSRRSRSIPRRRNWRGKPLVSYPTIVQLIAATTTRTGLNVKCEVDAASYPAGIKVSDDDMAMLNLTPHEFHGEWNYTIAPKPPG